MTTQSEMAAAFQGLHVKGDPLVLFNIWDAGSAQAVAQAGAKAVATGSWSVAAAQGYGDGEAIPLDLLLGTSERIVQSVDLPVSIDFEGAYAAAPEAVGQNVARLISTGAIGMNFEDQVVGTSDLYGVRDQTDRISAAREAANASGIDFFINARTDLFLKEPDAAKHGSLIEAAIERGQAYAAAGGSGFFAPALTDPDGIGAICEAVPLPVNVFMRPGLPDMATLAGLGVARISHGPGPYRSMGDWLTKAAGDALTQG